MDLFDYKQKKLLDQYRSVITIHKNRASYIYHTEDKISKVIEAKSLKEVVDKAYRELFQLTGEASRVNNY